jgi:hypothetical protein
VRDEQTHPHRPRLVVSHSTCPPLSSSPPANSFVIGPEVINTHTHIIHIRTHTRCSSRLTAIRFRCCLISSTRLCVCARARVLMCPYSYKSYCIRKHIHDTQPPPPPDDMPPLPPRQTYTHNLRGNRSTTDQKVSLDKVKQTTPFMVLYSAGTPVIQNKRE